MRTKRIHVEVATIGPGGLALEEAQALVAKAKTDSAPVPVEALLAGVRVGELVGMFITPDKAYVMATIEIQVPYKDVPAIDWADLRQVCAQYLGGIDALGSNNAKRKLRDCWHLIPTLVRMLDGARAFRGSGGKHTICEMVDGTCWICGSEE